MNQSKIEDGNVVFTECDCQFNIVGKAVNFCADLHNKNHTINFNCPATFNILSQGLTQGVFQLQSPLGVQWCSKLKPENIDHLSGLNSALRPGALEAKDDKNISITIHYERRKNGKEEITPFHPIIDKILEPTYGCMLFQEQSMEIAKQCAGFSLQEADILRRGIGHKEPETIAKCKILFLDKCKETKILSDKQAEQIFGLIEASQRYQFNASHSLSYALISYVTAYLKCHFPLQFYKCWLSNEDKREEYANFINEAKLFNINVYPPDLRAFRTDFYSHKRDIYFGLHNIKGLVKKDLDSLAKVFVEKDWKFCELGKSIRWLDFLAYGLESVSSKTTEGLIHSGSLDCLGLPRARLYYEYERWCRLTPKEKKALMEKPELFNDSDLSYYVQLQIIEEESYYKEKIDKYKRDLENRHSSGRTYKTTLVEPKENRRLPKLREILRELTSPLYNIEDTVDSIIFAEENLLGVALTKHKTDEIVNAAETANCLEILKGKKGYNVLRVKVEECRTFKCKNDTMMAFIQLSDKSGRLPAIAFNKEYDEYQHMLTRGNVVFVSGEMGQKDSFIIKRVYNVS